MSAAETPTSEDIRHIVAGLQHPVEIAIDRWGIAHIRAGSQPDVFLAQGFNAARDRLWHLDLWRKRGLGLLAADFGPGYLAQDRASRLFLYRGDMDAEWAAYSHPQAKDIATSFVAGINAYIDLVLAEPERLPAEFVHLGTRPRHWQPEDVVRVRSHALMRNADSELLRGLIMGRADAATDLLRRSIDPFRAPEIPDGLALADLREDALDDFKLACAPVTFAPERLACPLTEAWKWCKVDLLGEVIVDPDAEGSNNWAVGPARSATGRPVLATDPHRAYTMPSLRYLVHLQAPGLDVIGAGEPVQPGISLGHNADIAFALTILMMDQEDVYVYETDPLDPLRYRYGDGWETMRVEHEAIAVKGEAEQAIEMMFTRHGPVTCVDIGKARAFALRTVWTEPGSAPYFNSLGLLEARNLDDYRRVLSKWSVPAVNHVYADVNGHIAHMPVGKWPRRSNWDGLLPVPGDGRFEWDGFRPFSALPSEVDPACGFVASANENVLPPDFDPALHVSFEWTEGSRAKRVREVLAGQPQHTVAQSTALQTDVLSIPARRVCALIGKLDRHVAEHDDARRALEMLRAWDHRLSTDSAAAAVFELWWGRFLKAALFDVLVDDAVVRRLIVPGDVATLLTILEDPATVFDGDAIEIRDSLMAHSLGQAFAFCRDRMGADTATWGWGRLHHAYFEHALGKVVDAPGLHAGPLPIGGSGSTVMNTSYRPDFRAFFGASMRMVMDVGAWDDSVAINTPGQSGDPASLHYADLAGTWAAGEYFPLCYGKDAVDAATVSRIHLDPAPR
jgi:penicillin amidase